MTKNETKIYKIHSSKYLPDKIKKSKAIISESLAIIDRPYLSCSFGKDSIVLVHLVLSIDKTIPIVYVNCGFGDEWPDTARVKKTFLLQLPKEINFTELTGPSILIYFKKSGLFLQDEELDNEKRKQDNSYSKTLVKVLDKHAKELGYNGSYIGMRREESKIRDRLLKQRGPLYYNKVRKFWSCNPLSDWTSRDIWAYIVTNNLPYNELYDLSPVGRELARNGAMFGTRSFRYGRLSLLKQMYPSWFNKFLAKYPEIGRYI